MPSPITSEILIAGAGIIGLSLALELTGRGARVQVLDTGQPLGQASSAAAGMLAAEDPHNPPALHPLALLSTGLYPAFLERISSLSGLPVPFQTASTVQYAAGGLVTRLAEHSLDPRQLGQALLAALRSQAIRIHGDLGALHFEEQRDAVTAHATDGRSFRAARWVETSGAWASLTSSSNAMAPRKGQMLRVLLPDSCPLLEVHRSETVYIVPRTSGPQAGSALIGATVEDAGFDVSTHPVALAQLRAQASCLVPEVADSQKAPQLEAWAGLRPATPDLLPVLGRLSGSTRRWIASGHFRNGVLLAPATAEVMADLLEGRSPRISLEPFSPSRFLEAGELRPLEPATGFS